MDEKEYTASVRLKGDGSGLVGETKASTEAMRGLEEQTKRTSAALDDEAKNARSARTEGTQLKQTLDEMRSAQETLQRETNSGTQAVVAATTAHNGMRTALSGVLGLLGGPAGIGAMLATLALGWVSFGNAATGAADKSEDAARRINQAWVSDREGRERDLAKVRELQNELVRLRSQAAAGDIGFGPAPSDSAAIRKVEEELGALTTRMAYGSAPDLSLAPVVTRIKAEVAAFKRVGQAADLAAARRDLKQEPAAFVIPVSESPQANTLENGVSQFTRQRFSVVIAVQNLRDANAEQAQLELVPVRLALFDALIGWQPDPERDPCTFAGGRLLALTDRVLWWVDNFDTAYYLRKL